MDFFNRMGRIPDSEAQYINRAFPQPGETQDYTPPAMFGQQGSGGMLPTDQLGVLLGQEMARPDNRFRPSPLYQTGLKIANQPGGMNALRRDASPTVLDMLQNMIRGQELGR